MQHPDEGMIHSWLDGALSADDAAQVESHVGECASCAAVVAEARGFIAASSRILTALDDVPRGVLPAVPAKKRDLRVFWRAAAAMLVVAGGSLVVMLEGGPDARVASTSEAAPSRALDQATVATPSAPATEADESIRDARSLAGADAATTRPVTAAPPLASERRAESPRRSALSTRADAGRAESAGEVAGAPGAATGAAAPSALRMQMNPLVLESDSSPLKIVRVERSASSRRTIYQATPSETVTLTEPETDSTSASQIVLPGRSAAVTTGQAEMRATRSAPTSAEAAKEPPPPPSPMMDSKARTAFTSAENSISWRESGTGKTLTLSGKVSVEQLQEIRKRIEEERALSRENLPTNPR